MQSYTYMHIIVIIIIIIIIIIFYSHRTVIDGLTPWAGVAIPEGLTGGVKDLIYIICL